MAFTREQLADYEKGPQRKVSDAKNPFEGAKPAGVADAAAVAAVKAGQNLDATPGGAAAAATTATAADDSPVVDEDGTLGDPTESGEGTSDEQADPSTATDDPGVVADPNADLTGEQEEETATQAPAKGSAQERIVELNDRLEGAMVYGKSMQEQLKAQIEENQRLRTGSSTTGTTAATAAPPVEVNDDPGPMPDLSDEDVAFDTAKYRAKMQEWSTKNAQHVARKVVREMSGATQANQLVKDVNEKVETFAKTKPDFAEVVTNNQVLKANQLAPDAGLAVARSPYTAELLYKFGQDPGYAIRVAKMSPADQLLVVGEMIADIKAEHKAAGKTTTTSATSKPSNAAPRSGAQPAARKSQTNAPPPPKPTSGAGSAVRRDPLDPNMSVEEFARLHRASKQTAREQNRKLRGL